MTKAIPPKKARRVASKRHDVQAETARLKRQLATLKALQEIAHRLTSASDLNQTLAFILLNAISIARGNAGSILLFDPTTNELVFQVVQGGIQRAKDRTQANQGIVGWVFTHAEATMVNDVKADHRFLRGSDGISRFRTLSLIAAPVTYKGNPLGVIEVINKKSGEPFDRFDLELLSAFATQSAVAIEYARLRQQAAVQRERLVAIEDQVRKNLARELHDGPANQLSAMIMDLQFLKEVMARTPERAAAELTQIENFANQALHQVRNLLFDLRPLLLESQGLRAALEMFVQRHTETERTRLHLDTDSFIARLAPKSEAAIFSILQEAVTNAKKHAEAKNIWITMRQEGNAVTITVQDDGRGFDLQQIEEAYALRGSLGLLNMKERAEIANAKLTIAPQPGKGTRVTLVVPLDDTVAS